jgi:phenylalanyl-tRNA synthetase beta chain
MLVTLAWLNRSLTNPTTLDEATRALVEAGFPIESATSLANGDTRLDVEITSNRGDCLSVLGLARELAAKTGRTLRKPAPASPTRDAAPAADFIVVENTVPTVCPRFTARIVRGIKIGPSPAWLREALESVGQRSINNVVDATNYVNFEMGQPSHAFDLAKLAKGLSGKPTIIVRYANDKEELTTLDGKKRVLRGDELVVADAQRAKGLAGVMGGHDAEVTDATTDIVLEVATWDPVTVRRASRRHQLRTDASHRYERIVDARTVNAAAARLASLICEVSGGRLCDGAVVAGPELPPSAQVRLRPRRCDAILGLELSTPEIASILSALEIECSPLGRGGDELLCTIPPHRPDLTREIDLIEEVARIKVLDAIPMHDKVPVGVKPPQESERARREIASLLAGMGFFEAVTFSFSTRKEADLFMPAGLSRVEVADERRKEEPALRPSVLTGLLACRRANQNSGAAREGGIRLFETAAVFAQRPASKGALPESIENANLALLMDVPVKAAGKAAKIEDLQAGVRALRGAIETIVRTVAGVEASLVIEAGPPHCAAFDEKAYARISLGGSALGCIGLLSKQAHMLYDLAIPVVGAELNFPALLAMYPPRTLASALPAFPGIERDISLIVGEPVTWGKIESVIRATKVERLVNAVFVGTYRGQQIGKGRKSMTIRLAFRDPARTLKHEEVDGPVNALVERIKGEVGAELRA